MSPREVQWERMFPDELEAAFEACPVVYLPYGLCEPHGWHNAVGMDALRAHGCSCAAARAHGGIGHRFTGTATNRANRAPGRTGK